MIQWIKAYWENRKLRKKSPKLAEELDTLAYEEEALKRIKRINELREEVDKFVERRVKKRLPSDEERHEVFTPFKEKRRPTLEDLKRGLI